IDRRPEFRQLLIGISTMRYLPPSGTAGLARSLVNGKRRVPAPPPMMFASVRWVVPGGSAGVDIAETESRAPRFCVCTSPITQCWWFTATFLLGLPRLHGPAASGNLHFLVCVESSVMWGARKLRPFCSTDFVASNIAATIPPASPSLMAITSRPASAPVGSLHWPSSFRKNRPLDLTESATPAGQRTERSTTRTPTHISTPPARSPLFTTA